MTNCFQVEASFSEMPFEQNVNHYRCVLPLPLCAVFLSTIYKRQCKKFSEMRSGYLCVLKVCLCLKKKQITAVSHDFQTI